MPRGQPDFGVYAPVATVGAVSDLAELAVRLGSSNIFDRRGKVIDSDSFDDVRKGWTFMAIGGGVYVRSSVAPKSGSQSMFLTAAGIGVVQIELQRYFPRFASQRLGVECCIAAPDVDTYFNLILRQYDGVNEHSVWIRLDINSHQLAYLDDLGAFQTFATIDPLYIINMVYYPIKVVGDWSNNYYVRCVFAGVTYDLSAHAMYVAANATSPVTGVGLNLTLRIAPGGSIFVDDYILTMEEP